jgi:hypothetical protein
MDDVVFVAANDRWWGVLRVENGMDKSGFAASFRRIDDDDDK